MVLKAEVENMGNAYLRALRAWNKSLRDLHDATKVHEQNEVNLDQAANQLILVAPASPEDRYLNVSGSLLHIRNGWKDKNAVRVLKVEE